MIEIKIKPDTAEKTVFELKNDGVSAGTLTAVCNEEEIRITDICAEDAFVDGLVRTALSYAEIHGILICVFDVSDELGEKLKRLRFITDDCRKINDIAVFFQGKCSH